MSGRTFNAMIRRDADERWNETVYARQRPHNFTWCPQCGNDEGVESYTREQVQRALDNGVTQFWRLPERDDVVYASCSVCHGPHGYWDDLKPMTTDDVVRWRARKESDE